MNWLARLKKNEIAPHTEPTETTKTLSVVFVAPDMAPLHKTGGNPAANDASPDPDRWCWPHSSAMNGAEIDTLTTRQALFTDKGMSLDEAEALADKLVLRDRDADDRRLCLECSNFQGHRTSAWRCGEWQRAGIAQQAKDAQLSAALVLQLQRCSGFKSA
jgi:hypothetical protein